MKIYDLTRLITNDIPVWPGTPKPSFTPGSTLERDGFRETKVEAFSPGGTHMDAPAHMFADGKPLDEFPVNHFWGTAWVLDASKLGPGGRVTADMLDGFPAGADFLLVSTGWELFWNRVEYFGDFPLLTPEAIDRALSLGVRGIGLDTMSIDAMDSEDFPNHKRILSAGCVVIENLCNLAPIRGETVKFAALPLKFENSDGAPVRAVAEVAD